MMFRSIAIASVILGGSCAFQQIDAGAGGSSQAMSLATSIDPHLDKAYSGGWWSSEGDSGWCRIIVVAIGTEHVAHKVFVQWIKSADAEGVSSVINTQPVEELNRNLRLHVSRVEWVPGSTPIEFVLTVDSEESIEPIEYYITAMGLGEYAVGEP